MTTDRHRTPTRRARTLGLPLVGVLAGSVLAAPLVAAKPDTLFPSMGNSGYQVRAYDVAIDYAPLTNRAIATVRIRAVARQELRRFHLDFSGPEITAVTVDKQPATFKVGDGSLLPGFEQAIFGLKAGDKRAFEIEPERGFGPGNPQNLQTIPRDQFDEMELEEGLLVIFRDAAGGELPGVVKTIHDKVVEVDFNHPLAGKVITFDVEIINVQAA